MSKYDIHEHISILSKNKVPKDLDANEYSSLEYHVEDNKTIEQLFEALTANERFSGDLVLGYKYSSQMNDYIGYKVSQLIEKNKLTSITILNREHPFSDRISKHIGDSLRRNTSLRRLNVYLEIDELSQNHIPLFLTNSESNLEEISCLKVNPKLLQKLSSYMSNSSEDPKLRKIFFYYEPFTEINLLYKDIIEPEIYQEFADKIQSNSRIIEASISPWFDDFNQEWNACLSADVDKINETFLFSCNINKENEDQVIDIEKIYSEENNKLTRIM